MKEMTKELLTTCNNLKKALFLDDMVLVELYTEELREHYESRHYFKDSALISYLEKLDIHEYVKEQFLKEEPNNCCLCGSIVKEDDTLAFYANDCSVTCFECRNFDPICQEVTS